MARWRLNEPHYLFGRVAGEDSTCEWEYKEADRITGREKRKRFKVPDYRNVNTVVCYEGSEKDSDFIMEGPPTPGMEPLDDEAREISRKHEKSWIHPIESLPTQLGPEAIQMMGEFAKMIGQNTSVAVSGVSKEDFDKVMARLAKLETENAELAAAAVQKVPTKPKDLRI